MLCDRGLAISPGAGAGLLAQVARHLFPPEVENLPDQAHDGTSVRREVYAVSKQRAEVVVYAIKGGGHTWSGGPQYLPVFLVGKASHNLDATQAIWDFFKRRGL